MEDPTSAEGLLKVKSNLSSKLLSDLNFFEKTIAATVSRAMFLPIIFPAQSGQVWKSKVLTMQILLKSDLVIPSPPGNLDMSCASPHTAK